MKLIVGLGNPGEKYASNRHNIGFAAADEIARGYRFGPWKKRFQGVAAEGQIGTVKCLILRPGTYMNESGRAGGEAMRFYKLDASDVIVVHDELDLNAGDVRVKKGGGNAGHNGLKSLSAHIGNDYTRVRLGIGHPGDKALVAAYVLQDFAKADRSWIEPLLDGVAKGMARLVEGSEAAFLSEAARGRIALAPAPKTRGRDPEPAAERVSAIAGQPRNALPEDTSPPIAVSTQAETAEVSIEALLAAASKPIEAMPVHPLPSAAREGGGGGATSRPVFVAADTGSEPEADVPAVADEVFTQQIETSTPEPAPADFLTPALGEAPAADMTDALAEPVIPSFAAAIAEAPAPDASIEWMPPTPSAPEARQAASLAPDEATVASEPANPAQQGPRAETKGVSTRLKSWFQSRVRGAPAQ